MTTPSGGRVEAAGRIESQSITAQQQKEIKALAAALKGQASQIRKVSAELELQKPPAQTVLNDLR